MPHLKNLQRLRHWWERLGPLDPANVISILRGMLGLGCVFAVWYSGIHAANWIILLIALAMLSDSVDGTIARYYGFGGEIGKLTDMRADHWFAACTWFSLYALSATSMWVFIITFGRDYAVDYLREVRFYATGRHGFDRLESHFGWLASSRFMRGSYATLKVAAWIALLLQLNGSAIVTMLGLNPAIINNLVGLTVVVCLIRAIPYLNWYPIFPKARPV